MTAARRLLVALLAFAFLFGTVERAASVACFEGHERHASMKDLCPSEQRGSTEHQCPSGKHHEPCLLHCMAAFNIIAAKTFAVFVARSSSTLLPLLMTSLTGRSLVLDPGIPKRMV
jgi:hypothetical protein